MGLFAGLFKREKRDISSTDPYLGEWLGMRSTGSKIVSPETATAIPAVHACVQVIAETISSLPLPIYRRMDNEGKEVDKSHPLYQVLNIQANPAQTSMEFREQLLASCALTGNGYALKEIDGRGAIKALYPLHPGQVHPEKLINGRVRYVVTPDKGGTVKYTQDEIFHLRYRSSDGFTGLSPITIARETIGIALAQQEYETSLMTNAAMPAGALEHPSSLNEKQKNSLRQSIKDITGGTRKAGNLIVLEEGMKYQQISLSQKDAEFIESRKLTLEDIVRIYRVPPPTIGILDKATYSNITEQSRMLVMHCLRPWMVRLEKAMTMSLLTEHGRRTHFIEHNAEGLLRGSIKERYEAYRIAREWGWLNVNEIRRKENEASIGEDGDTYRQPMNSEPLGTEE